jgi:quinoprotein glucose dehydrogenase
MCDPSWGRLSAVDLGSGETRWEKPLGKIPQLALLGLSERSATLGSPNLGGTLVTRGGLVFIGAAMDTRLRAYDSENGNIVWEAELPASAQAAPMTYSMGGRQFVVICAGGHGKLGTKRGDHVVAFALGR